MTNFTSDGNNRAHRKATNDDGSSIVVYEQGAHLTSWVNSSGHEMLYTSPNAQYADNVAIRGGAMVVFPKLTLYGPNPEKNGFAASRPWAIDNMSSGVIVMSLDVKLDEIQRSNHEASAESDHTMHLEYTIKFNNNQLTLDMKVSNRDDSSAASINVLFQTYFAVSDLSSTFLSGLNFSPYIDCTRVDMNATGYGPLKPPAVTNYVKDHFHRIYPDLPCAVVLQDIEKPYVLHISGSPGSDMVVFNPGAEKSELYPDLPAEGYKNFVSITHGNVLRLAEVSPSSSIQQTQTIHVLHSKKENSAAPTSSKL